MEINLGIHRSRTERIELENRLGKEVEKKWNVLRESLAGAAKKVVGGRSRQENEWGWRKELREILKRKKQLFKEWKRE